MSILSRPLRALLCAMACAALLAACGDKASTDAGQAQDQAEALPKPDAPAASVTGMSSKPGPGEVPLTGAPPPPVAVEPADQVDLLNPETGLLPGGATPPADGAQATAGAAEPTAQDAAAVIGEYYAAIDAGSYARAYALWSDGGRASRQTPEQFAGGFADTARVVATLGAPVNADAGAGQRYIQVPVAITATRKDGSVHRYDGTYTLHRTVVDGASQEQRAWRIASADLRELKP
ncbi:MAG TPA: hypothetical protein VM619_00745 [Luteimonas sp.]|nr:hypothetical protein [Luteimonas sp.]